MTQTNVCPGCDVKSPVETSIIEKRPDAIVYWHRNCWFTRKRG